MKSPSSRCGLGCFTELVVCFFLSVYITRWPYVIYLSHDNLEIAFVKHCTELLSYNQLSFLKNQIKERARSKYELCDTFGLFSIMILYSYKVV